MVTILGPDGTGKTFVATTNATALHIAIALSNLSKRPGVLLFRLLVSKNVVSYYSEAEMEFYTYLVENDQIYGTQNPSLQMKPIFTTII
jgi:hypothetical protein